MPPGGITSSRAEQPISCNDPKKKKGRITKEAIRVGDLFILTYNYMDKDIMKHSLVSKDVRWVNVQSPTAEELADFVRETGVDKEDAEFIAQAHQRPEVALKPGYILLLLNVPVFERKLRVTMGSSLYFVIKERELFSLHYDPIVSIDAIRKDFEASPEKQEDYFGEDALSLCLYIINSIYNGAFRKLDRLSKHIDIAEDAVFLGNERKMVEEISILTRDVMDFRRVIRPQASLFRVRPNHNFLNTENSIRWVRIHGLLMKMWEHLESMFESVKELNNTNFTLLQHKENELLRTLTLYSILVIPMIFLVDPYFAPGAANADIWDKAVFWLVMGLLVVALIGIAFGFRKKRLL
jgi:magnesium transporter